jgi:hypothetical protein
MLILIAHKMRAAKPDDKSSGRGRTRRISGGYGNLKHFMFAPAVA